MIFVTVGHQQPFDRLVRAMDEWAGRAGRRDVFAQIGASRYRPKRCEFARFLTPRQFHARMEQADAIVGHAGTGTIIEALTLKKPLLVLPRLSRLGETRNDHQVPTARHFAQSGRVLAAADEAELLALLERIEHFRPAAAVNGHASPGLLERLSRFAMNEA